jgi:GxxExxY protein
MSQIENVKIENQISYKIRGAIFSVYNELGPGLLESIYEKALLIELQNSGIDAEVQVPIKVRYKGMDLGMGLRIDLFVNKNVIVEIKSVENLHNIHFKQVLSYLKITGIKLGLLVNFNSNDISKSIHRIVNNL